MAGVAIEVDAVIRKQVEAILAEYGFISNRDYAMNYVRDGLAEAQYEIDSGAELDDAYVSLKKVASKYGV